MIFEKKDVKFIKSASRLEESPAGEMPEIALAGRSNSGKSSLINSLSKNSKMAKVSSSPGKTELLNFFEVDGLFRLVDMPGYGYAKKSWGARDSWRIMIENFLGSRELLCGVLLIMDARRKWTEDEEALFAWLGPLGLPMAVAATKMDKMNQKERSHQLKSLEASAQCAIFPVSNVTGHGFRQLYSFLVQDWVLPKREQLSQLEEGQD